MLVQLTDPHVRVGPADQGSAARLEAAVRTVLALPMTPDAVVVTGDLVEHGDPVEYARVRELLAPLPMPVHVLPGNHDDRDVLRDAFGLPGGAGEPVRFAAACGPLRLVACDTTLPGRAEGRLDVAWLEARLAEDRSTPTVVAMHHAPMAIGIPVMDAIGLPEADRRPLAELLARSPQVRRVISGHVHRSVVAALGGCAVFALSGTSSQLRLDFAAEDFDTIDEPSAIAVHALVDGEVVSHLEPVAGA